MNMKRLILLSLLVFIGLNTASALGPILGDANFDEKINIVDALVTAQHSVGMSVGEINKAMADVDISGTINIQDALMIAQYSVGAISELPGHHPAPHCRLLRIPLIPRDLINN